MISKRFFKRAAVAMVSIAMVVTTLPSDVGAATYEEIHEAQQIMTNLGLPTGPVDGLMGPKTQRGLCAFRYISGETVTRSSTIDSSLMNKLQQYDNQYDSLQEIPARKNTNEEHLVAQKTCQVMFHAMDGNFTRAMPMSTGSDSVGIKTPNEPRNANRSYFWLHGTHLGWECSNQYPGSCKTETAGQFSYISDYGNMYNMRWMEDGGLFVHGSMNVPTYPGSAGCIRMNPSDSDWMYYNVGNYGHVKLFVEGEYVW